MENIEYRVLGTVEARLDGQVADLGPPKQRAVLAVLVLNAGGLVSSDRIVEAVWGDRPPRTAAHSVQIYVSGLRGALEALSDEPAILTTPPGYTLRAAPGAIDADRFERLIDDARATLVAEPDRAAQLAKEALELWRGAPLADFAHAEFAREPARRLEQLRLDALETIAAAELALERPQSALAAVETAIHDDPLRERLRELQIIALYRCGRHPDALRMYQEFRRLLADELGILPSPELQRLNEQVLLHDPSLSATAPPPVVAVRNPYKGLRPFEADDAGDFFGRDRLVAQIVAALGDGLPLLALVGPSGCGKSSVLNAGLLPALRTGALTASETWAIVTIRPGPTPVETVEDALRTGGRLLLAIDQFEELFALSDEDTAGRVLRMLTAAIAERPVTIVLALRADYYDRPLMHPGFAELLAAGLINVLPMSPEELEVAVREPARRVGLDVEPALLTELVADTTDQVGGLPLLQFTLAELFENRTGAVLSLADYREMGGLRALVSRRCEESFVSLEPQAQRVALQVFLRLVNLGDAARPGRRRAPLRELTAMDVDPVALSAVLEEFARHRLLSFDRDADGGDATVEVAHEALLWEWQRLAAWCDTHRDDLRRHRSVAAAAGEWEAVGRDPDYLVSGSRLAEWEAWSARTTLRLTASERAFLDSALERRRVEEEHESARRARQRQLERRASRRLWALAATILVLAGATAIGVRAWLNARPPEMALVYYGGDGAIDIATAAGFDRAVKRLGIDVERHVVSPIDLAAELRHEAERGVDLLVVGGGQVGSETVDAVARKYPHTRFLTVDQVGERPNVTYVSFADHEGSFLAGVAAARKSRTGSVGFVGGAPIEPIRRFHAGFAAGARAVDPDIRIRARYLSRPPDFSGFNSYALAYQAARQLYASGADVVYHAAGYSGFGVVGAAHELSEKRGAQLWAIGVDGDQYREVETLDPAEFGIPNDAKRRVLTSMIKRVDRAVDAALDDYKRGRLRTGVLELGLRAQGVELARSGGFIDDIQSEIDRYRRQIADGTLHVPTVPGKRRS